MQQGVPLSHLPIEVMREHAAEIDPSIRDSLGAENAVAAFVSDGSTAPDQIRSQISAWQNRLSQSSL